MIERGIRELCLVSVFCGAAMRVCPEGGVKKVLAVLSTAVLMLSLINPLKSVDFSTLALENAKLRRQEAELSLKGSEINQQLSRLVIEDECEAYIMDKAEKLKLQCDSVKLEAKWSSDGLWVPCSVKIKARGEEETLARLGAIIEAELGIPAEKQYWS